MKRTRRNFPAAEKAKILRRHLVDKAAVSDLCDEYGLHPTVFYRWQKALFENAAAALEHRGPTRRQKAEEARINVLEEKMRKKDEVLAELMEEHLALKKKQAGAS